MLVFTLPDDGYIKLTFKNDSGGKVLNLFKKKLYEYLEGKLSKHFQAFLKI